MVYLRDTCEPRGNSKVVDEQRPVADAASSSPTDDDVTVEAGKKYLLLIFSFAVLLWIVGWGVHREWWTLPLPALGLTALGIIIGVVSKYEEKRLRAARFTRRANVVALSYVCVLTVLVLVIGLWGSPSARRIGDVFGSVAPTAATPSGTAPTQPVSDPGAPTGSNCQEPAVSFPTPWGPDRPLISDRYLTTAGPFSSQPTFNNVLLKGAPGESDEDMRARLVAARPSRLNNPGGFLTDLQVVPDEEYRVRISVVNSGSSSIAGTTAFDSRVRIALPQCPTAAVRMVGVATSSNAVPSPIWSTVTFTSDRPFRLIPSGRAAKICSKLTCTNSTFSTFTREADLYGPEGVLLGANSDAPDGVLPGLLAVDILVYVKAVF